MFFEILLLSVIMVTLWLGPMVVRRSPPGMRTYGWMLVADLAVAIVAFVLRQGEPGSRLADLLGAVAIGGGVFLVVVPPILREQARRAMMKDRLRLAIFLISLREHLQPNMGAKQEREVVEAILAVRSGKVEAAVDALQQTKSTLEHPIARRQIDERIVMTYLYAHGWENAIGHFESTIDSGPASPQLLVEMVRAYCEVDEMQKAADLVERLEASPLAQEPILDYLIQRARLTFLAFVGRTRAVDLIVAPTGPLATMPAWARSFWSGVARLRAGDSSGARSSLEEAARLSGRDRRSREIAESTLGTLENPGILGPHAMPQPVAELADRLTSMAEASQSEQPASNAPQISGLSWRAFPVTIATVLANLGVALALAFAGPSGDFGVLAIYGANVKSAVAAGEWWRLPASMFLHVGVLHLALNMFGLWVLGKLGEQFFGSLRFFAIYVGAGIAGAFASFGFGAPGLSAGASGAIFGLLGAAIVELGLHRDGYPDRWRRILFSNLVFLTAAQIAIGFYYPAIDQSAHIGGFVTGGLLAALFSHKNAFAGAAWVRAVALLLVSLCGASLVYAGASVATYDFADTLSRMPRSERVVDGFRLVTPTSWQTQGRELRGSLYQVQMLTLTDEMDVDALERGLPAPSLRVGEREFYDAPAPWLARSYHVVQTHEGGESRQRFILAWRKDPQHDRLWFVFVAFPEAIFSHSKGFIDDMLRSVRAVGDPGDVSQPLRSQSLR